MFKSTLKYNKQKDFILSRDGKIDRQNNNKINNKTEKKRKSKLNESTIVQANLYYDKI